ncbi:hypothetical protein K4F52_006548 [Lecanicillium sp. MT-2017a]|nr:hypothetical protein K4F52_006548 [Lecanicillium sp. MT-2017a]
MANPFARPAFNFKTPRVLLRTATESDAAAFHKHLINPANTPHQPTEDDLTIEQVLRRIAYFEKVTIEGKHGWIIFESRETGDFLGYGGYNCFEEVDAEEFLGTKPNSPGTKYLADWGIMMDHKYWGKGYAREIAICLIEYARSLGCGLFRTETDVDNEAWKGLMKGIGLAAFEQRGKASYDETKELLTWKWDVDTWEKAKAKLQGEGRWTDLA